MTRHKPTETKKTPKTEIHVDRQPRSVSLDRSKRLSSSMEKLFARATAPRSMQDKKREHAHDRSDESDTETPPAKIHPEEVTEEEDTATASAELVAMNTDAAPDLTNADANQKEEGFTLVSSRNEKRREKALNNASSREETSVTTQHGFRPKLSTETALLHVSKQIHDAIDNREIYLLTLCDLSKAFDSASHTILLKKNALN